MDIVVKFFTNNYYYIMIFLLALLMSLIIFGKKLIEFRYRKINQNIMKLCLADKQKEYDIIKADKEMNIFITLFFSFLSMFGISLMNLFKMDEFGKIIVYLFCVIMIIVSMMIRSNDNLKLILLEKSLGKNLDKHRLYRRNIRNKSLNK